MTDGGEGTVGVLYTEERRKAISNRLKGRPGTIPNEETRQKMRQAKLGHKMLPQTKEAIHKATTGKPRPDHVIEAVRKAQTGKKLTKEQIEQRTATRRRNKGGNY
jgi:hypothetical protein